MTDLDLTPVGAGAPRVQRVVRHAAMEALLIGRNGEQLLLALAIPAGALIAGRTLGPRVGLGFDVIVPGILALALWSTAFTSLAIATAFERRYGVLERLAATPLRRTGFLQGKALAVAIVASAQAALLVTLAVVLGWRPTLQACALIPIVLTAVLATVAFANAALICASSMRAEAVLGVANLVYLVGAGCGLVTPVDVFPAWSHPILQALPTAALAESLRASFTGGALWWPVLPSAFWAVASSLVVRKVFRWTS